MTLLVGVGPERRQVPVGRVLRVARLDLVEARQPARHRAQRQDPQDRRQEPQLVDDAEAPLVRAAARSPPRRARPSCTRRRRARTGRRGRPGGRTPRRATPAGRRVGKNHAMTGSSSNARVSIAASASRSASVAGRRTSTVMTRDRRQRAVAPRNGRLGRRSTLGCAPRRSDACGGDDDLQHRAGRPRRRRAPHGDADVAARPRRPGAPGPDPAPVLPGRQRAAPDRRPGRAAARPRRGVPPPRRPARVARVPRRRGRRDHGPQELRRDRVVPRRGPSPRPRPARVLEPAAVQHVPQPAPARLGARRRPRPRLRRRPGPQPRDGRVLLGRPAAAARLLRAARRLRARRGDGRRGDRDGRGRAARRVGLPPPPLAEPSRASTRCGPRRRTPASRSCSTSAAPAT